ncbi:cyclic nucleotide-binding domain-containing protein [Bradyrhizobium daqingense]|uniref:Cyclic nucleotide-binding domain-containing protein n=1 Tax=Bradyrhizobium daqingense TaxID=993502 RepID=A0A562KJW5_9BRAD|nr:cyclic nucleotide-binding domain-containing protein [Bradyrhizobium daqingense]TWH95690.1 Cyclic nucleotide-binding domain-containing protein [Bradyrhizobium daqingense]UFS91521.1 cyclic nucleotide-binding domain-containing protein [Bradyrhizobium daqingense]
MTLIEAIGYLASALVLLTFCMSTMLSLRAVAICSNFAFISYGFGAGLYPVLVLHVVLLPLNIVLLVRMMILLRKAKLAAATDLSPLWMQPFMWPKHFKAGETIFRKGQHADLLYMVASGEVGLPEIDQRLSAGDLFGEIGLFSLERRRTQTAVAATNVDLLCISDAALKKLCERNPGLSLYFLRLTATRMTQNASRLPPIGAGAHSD